MAPIIEGMRDKKIRTRFQRNLSRIRRLIGWTTEDLGQILEVSKQTIGNWEKIENGEVKKLIPFSQAVALNYFIREKLIELEKTDYSKYIYITMIGRTIIEEDNLELEKIVEKFTEANYKSKSLTFEETNSLLENELRNVIEKKNKENIKQILFWISKLIVDYELGELRKKANKLLDELTESLSDLSVYRKYDILKHKNEKLNEDFFIYRKHHLADINVSLSANIEATIWANTFILNILSFPISQEQIDIITEKLLKPTINDIFDKIGQDDKSSENYVKYARAYFLAPNMQFVVLNMLKKKLVDNKEKYNLGIDANVISRKIDKVNELFSKYEKEWHEEFEITRENFKEIYYSKAVNVYGDIVKRFEEIYGEEAKSKLLKSVDEGKLYEEISSINITNEN